MLSPMRILIIPMSAINSQLCGVISDRQTISTERWIVLIDIVVHAAPALPLYKPADMYSTDANGARTVLYQSVRHYVTRVIHISWTAVYGSFCRLIQIV